MRFKEGDAFGLDTALHNIRRMNSVQSIPRAHASHTVVSTAASSHGAPGAGACGSISSTPSLPPIIQPSAAADKVRIRQDVEDPDSTLCMVITNPEHVMTIQAACNRGHAAKRRFLTTLALLEPALRHSSQVHKLAAHMSWRWFRAGSIVIHEGGLADGVYFVKSGGLKVLQRTPSSERLVRVLGPGDCFGLQDLAPQLLRGGGAPRVSVVRFHHLFVWPVLTEIRHVTSVLVNII
jgi:hypothetical protein